MSSPFAGVFVCLKPYVRKRSIKKAQPVVCDFAPRVDLGRTLGYVFDRLLGDLLAVSLRPACILDQARNGSPFRTCGARSNLFLKLLKLCLFAD